VIWAGQAIAVTVLMLMAYRPYQAKPMNALGLAGTRATADGLSAPPSARR